MTRYSLTPQQKRIMLDNWAEDMAIQHYQAEVNYALATDREDSEGQEQSLSTAAEMKRSLATLERLSADLPEAVAAPSDDSEQHGPTHHKPLR